MNNDLFLSIDVNSMNIISFDSAGLSLSGDFSTELIISTHRKLIEDEFFHGVKLSLHNDLFVLQNDFFCLIPVYYRLINNSLLISSNPQKLLGCDDAYTIDKSGVWESILFGNCIYDRTIFNEIKQLPPLHEIKLSQNELHIMKYQELRFFENTDTPYEDTIENIHERLMELFDAHASLDSWSIGVSGGLDSRLSLGHMGKWDKERIYPFTFFASKNSLELELSENLCKELNLRRPKQFQLFPNVYNKYLSFLSKNTGGQIGFQHSHVIHCLANFRSKAKCSTKQLSNYFTDAVFGWATEKEKRATGHIDSWSSLIHDACYIPEKIRLEILSDISKVFNGYSEEQNFSSKDEYKYIFERNQKFHINLAFQQNKICSTYMPYCDYKLMSLVFSLPLHVRHNKRISEILIERVGLKNTPSLSSRQMVKGGGFSQKLGLSKYASNFNFKLSNFMSLVMAFLSKGSAVYPNMYQTEAHYNLYFKLHEEFLSDFLFMKEMKIFDDDSLSAIRNMSLRDGKTVIFFQVHSLVKYLKAEQERYENV